MTWMGWRTAGSRSLTPSKSRKLSLKSLLVFVAVRIEMAIAKMLRPDFQQRRVNRLLHIHYKRAPRMKTAPWREGKSPRDFTRADYLLRLDLLLSVAAHHDRGEKPLPVRMDPALR